MKKSLILLTVILVLAMSIALTACGNVPQQLVLQAPWNEYKETSTYDVYDEYTAEKKNVIGEMTVSYQRFNDVNIDLNATYVAGKFEPKNITPDFKDPNFYGFIVTTDLVLKDGQYKHSIAVTNKQLVTRYSYSKSYFEDKNNEGKFEDIEQEYTYGEKKVDYKVKGTDAKGNVDIASSIKYKPFAQIAYFDNIEYLGLTKTLGKLGEQRQLSFLTPSWRQDKMMKRVATASNQRVEIAPHEAISIKDFTFPEPPKKEGEEAKPEEPKTTVPCYRHVIASGETMPGSGTPINYYVASIPYTNAEGIKVEGLLMKFVEHDITYVLKDIKMVQVNNL